MKPITGQYECVHRSGIGLDYFTSRIDRLIVQANGRFSLIVQEHSRASGAAQSLISGQQVSAAAPEVRREGSYTQQEMTLWLNFDDGAQEQGQLSLNGDGVQIGKNFFTKVSDSTLLPPTHRMKQDMDDIAKGLKLASTLGGFAVKAAKTINETLQATKETGIGTQLRAKFRAATTTEYSHTQPYQPVQNGAPMPQQPPVYQSPVAPPLAAQNPPEGQPRRPFLRSVWRTCTTRQTIL